MKKHLINKAHFYIFIEFYLLNKKIKIIFIVNDILKYYFYNNYFFFLIFIIYFKTIT